MLKRDFKPVRVKSTASLFFIAIFVLVFSPPEEQASSTGPTGTISFTSNRNSKPPNEGLSTTVYLIETDGSNERKWLEDPQAGFGRIAWSPDGKQAAFAKVKPEEFPPHIFVMNIHTREQKNLTARFGDGTYLEPAWSRDGKRLAFSCRQLRLGNFWSICVMDVAGNNLKDLTRRAKIDTDPNWSPVSSKIVYTSTQQEGPGEIYMMGQNGENQVNLTIHPSIHPTINTQFGPPMGERLRSIPIERVRTIFM